MQGFWNGASQPGGRILYGTIGEENPNHPGLYKFASTDGYVISTAHLLTPDADIQGGGEVTKPRPGSPCVAVFTTDGAECFIIGMHRPPRAEDEDSAPEVGNPDENQSSGDKVYKTAGGASLILKRGGAVVVEGGAGTGVTLNPVNNKFTVRGSNGSVVADGYRVRMGRKEPGSSAPETTTDEEFRHQVGPGFDRVRVRHGSVGGGARREITVSSVKVISSQETETKKARERYFSDGSWVAEGPEFRWGGKGASEPSVLGNQLVAVIKEISSIIKGLKVNTAWGPSTPPLPDTILKLSQLEQEVSGKILSTYLFLTKDPVEPG